MKKMQRWVVLAVLALVTAVNALAYDPALDGYWQTTKKSNVKRSLLFSGDQYVMFDDAGIAYMRGTYTNDSKGNLILTANSIYWTKKNWQPAWKKANLEEKWYTFEELMPLVNCDKAELDYKTANGTKGTYAKKDENQLYFKWGYAKIYMVKSNDKKPEDYLP